MTKQYQSHFFLVVMECIGLEVVHIDIGDVEGASGGEPVVDLPLDTLVSRQPGERIGPLGQAQVDLGNGAASI